MQIQQPNFIPNRYSDIKIFVLDSIYSEKIKELLDAEFKNRGIYNMKIFISGGTSNPLSLINAIKKEKPQYIIFEHWYYNKIEQKFYPYWDQLLDILYSNFLIEKMEKRKEEWKNKATIFSKFFDFFFTKKDNNIEYNEENWIFKVNDFYSKLISINSLGAKIRDNSKSYNKFTIHWFIKDKSIIKMCDRIIDLEKRKG